MIFLLSLLIVILDFCSSNIIISNSDQIISLPFNEILSTFASTIYFGSNRQQQFKRINLSKQFTWFTKESFNLSQSSSYAFIKNTELNFGFASVIAEESTENIEISRDSNRSVILNDFPFYLINNSNYFDIRYGSLGLAYKFTDERFSIIHQLKKSNYISRLAFGFYPHFLSNGLFYLGGLPKTRIKDTYSASCKLKSFDSNWSCSLSQISISTEKNETFEPSSIYNNSDHSYFQSADSKIFSPRKYMMHLASSVFKPFIDNNTCSFVTKQGFAIINCQETIKMSQYHINFAIDDYAYSIKFMDLFTCKYSYCEFDIISSKWNKNTWVFGTAFLKHFYSEFDYEKKMITFYSKTKEFKYIGNGSLLYNRTILITNCSMLLIFCFVNIAIRNKIKA